jgi:uncharacterized protein YdeI (YjbR/CyaY-like superfamily)
MATKGELPILELSDCVEWEAWLAENHASSAGAWLKIAKKGSRKRSPSQTEAIDGAVCVGWIDGQIARHDEDFYLQRFTPRRARSKWSEINRERAQRLIAEGRMRPAGFAQYDAAQADGRLDDAYAPQSRATVPEDLQAALRDRPEAQAFFDSLTSAERYRLLYRLHHTSQGRRAQRVASYVELLSERKSL